MELRLLVNSINEKRLQFKHSRWEDWQDVPEVTETYEEPTCCFCSIIKAGDFSEWKPK